MTIEVEAYAQADELMADWMQVWLRAQEEDGPYYVPFWEFIETAADAVARGMDYGSRAEEAAEDMRSRYYGDGPEPRWGQVDEDRCERAWSYVLSTPEEVLALLAERGHPVKSRVS